MFTEMQIQKNTESVRIVMQPRFKNKLVEKASQAGVSLSTYVKHVLMQTWNYDDMPTFKPSKALIKSFEEAQKEIAEEGLKPDSRPIKVILDEIYDGKYKSN
jgi:hypothetical protein